MKQKKVFFTTEEAEKLVSVAAEIKAKDSNRTVFECLKIAQQQVIGPGRQKNHANLTSWMYAYMPRENRKEKQVKVRHYFELKVREFELKQEEERLARLLAVAPPEASQAPSSEMELERLFMALPDGIRREIQKLVKLEIDAKLKPMVEAEVALRVKSMTLVPSESTYTTVPKPVAFTRPVIRILVVGLKPSQQEELQRNCPEWVKLKFVGSDTTGSASLAISANAEHSDFVILMTKFTSHAKAWAIPKAKLQYHNGGIDTLKALVRKLSATTPT